MRGELVDQPGASDVFDESYITYSNEAKQRLLGVNPATLARYGLTPAQCMAFGDSDNDIGLLTAAGIGVAMEAGTDGARAAADFVTRDCEADGIRYALEYFSVL